MDNVNSAASLPARDSAHFSAYRNVLEEAQSTKVPDHLGKQADLSFIAYTCVLYGSIIQLNDSHCICIYLQQVAEWPPPKLCSSLSWNQ
eukprot:4957476-Amphidinium_carterae.1